MTSEAIKRDAERHAKLAAEARKSDARIETLMGFVGDFAASWALSLVVGPVVGLAIFGGLVVRRVWNLYR